MYAIVDIETTGGFAAGHGITEIAIFVHDGTRVTDSFHSLINPHQKIPLYITALTGISNAMVASAPSFEEVAEEIFTLLNNQVFVAHNVNFDYSFVRHHLKKSGYEMSNKKLCTVRLGRKVFPGLPSYSLGNFCRSMNVLIEQRHRATGDAQATVLLFEKMLAAGGQQHIDQMLRKTSAEQWLPTQVERKVIDALPAQPGVYYFHNSKGKIIYVGKAINIRKRVSSHFTHNDGEKKRQNFLRHVTDITCKTCANELHALVLESAEIKRLWPKYNYSQKQPVQRYGLYSFEDNRGYIRLAIDRRKKNLQALYHFNLLHEGQVLLRRMAKEFELHEKLCFIDRTPLDDNDLSYLEPPLYYNGKIKLALEALQQQLPSFALVEPAPDPLQKICILIERGSFWGMGYVPAAEMPQTVDGFKEKLEPYADNDFIRNAVYAYAAANPASKMLL